MRDLFFTKVHLSIGRGAAKDLLAILIHAIKALWLAVSHDLAAKGEIARFLGVEVPIYNVLLNTQLEGIRLDRDNLETQRRALTNEHYAAQKRLLTEFRLSNSDLSRLKLRERLAQIVPSLKARDPELENFDDYVRIAASTSQFAHTAEVYRRSLTDKLTLERMGATGTRIFPVFDVVGTVTSRALVLDPQVQHLRRKYRSVLIPDDGKVFAYLDYKQFEPGILAQMSGDKNLIGAYNKADLYLMLSRALFDDEQHRDLCKRLFLGFSYGMERATIVELLAADTKDSSAKVRIAQAVDEFFGQFSDIVLWKERVWEELARTGRIGTALGNYRYRRRQGELLPEEKRWAISQLIQGTASLILKRAMLKIASLGRECKILLPMHDAVLVQISEGNKADVVSEVRKVLESEFREHCPDTLPVVEIKEFAA